MNLDEGKITDRLLKHSFVIKTIEDHSNLLDKISERIEESGSKVDEGYKHLETAQEYYINNVSRLLTKLLDAVDRIHQIPFFIRIYPNTNLFKKKGITKHKWIKYHHSNFIIYIISIYDNALLLVNRTLNIGLKARDCNNNTIKKNRNVRNTKIFDALNELDNYTKKFREDRNLIVHRSHEPEQEYLDLLNSRLFLLESEEKFDIKIERDEDSFLNHKHVVKRLYDDERNKLAEDLFEHNKEIVEILIEFFSALEPYYKYYINKKNA